MRPRVLEYDELYQWLESCLNDAMDLAAEYGEQGDIDDQLEQRARADAFASVQSHIDYMLEEW